MAERGSSGVLAAVLVLIGAVLLIACVFLPWYGLQLSENVSGTTLKETTSFYPGLPTQNGTVSYSCSNVPTCPSTTSYNKLGLNNTGTIAETGYYLLIAGFVLGLLGAIVGVASRGNPHRMRAAIALAAVAMILAIVAPAAYAVTLPGAVSNDSKGHPTGPGPWTTFFGSGNGSAFGVPGGTANWGPGVGWYLSFAAFAVLLVGMVLLIRARRRASAPSPPTGVPPWTGPVQPPTAP